MRRIRATFQPRRAAIVCARDEGRDRADRDGDAGSTRSEVASELAGESARRRPAARDRVRGLAHRSGGARARRCSTRAAGAGGRLHDDRRDRRPARTAECARAIGLYGDWLRVGIGVATELPKSRARAQPRRRSPRGRRARHDGRTRSIRRATSRSRSSTAAAATRRRSASPRPRPRRRSAFVGGSASTELGSTIAARTCGPTARRSPMPASSSCSRASSPFEAVTSQHMIATDREDGRHRRDRAARSTSSTAGPRRTRLRELVASARRHARRREPSRVLVRALRRRRAVRALDDRHIEGSRIHLACAVEVGHVLRLMRPGDLIGQTRATSRPRPRASAASIDGAARVLVHRPPLGGRGARPRARARRDVRGVPDDRLSELRRADRHAARQSHADRARDRRRRAR